MNNNNRVIIFWFRNDLRLSDNPGFSQAVSEGKVMPIYIFDQESVELFKMGSASRWWLYHSLKSLDRSLQEKLNIYHGCSQEVFKKLLHLHNVEAIYWSRCYEPYQREQEDAVSLLLQQHKIKFQYFNASLLWEPGQILTTNRQAYQRFTPFYGEAILQNHAPRAPLPAPTTMVLLKDTNNPLDIDSLPLLSKTSWYTKMDSLWAIGESPAQYELSHFLKTRLPLYHKNRDFPAIPSTSRLSAYLHFGEISPHQVWHSVQQETTKFLKKDGDAFLRELAWREFFYHQLFHFPKLTWKNVQPKFDGFPWCHNEVLLKAWQQGKTGYPIIDAGMRELWQTGTMHNRVRMIVASFLTKNMLIDWRDGAAWFWDTLVDADLASNSCNWQWVAGCGVDAAPYFRIFNPVLQAEKFDPEGIYIRHYIPELSQLPKKFLFTPWLASKSILEGAGILLGKTYPIPIVDLQLSRERALEAYHSLGK
ncbi:MAG: DNA photolyase family protein [Chthoniobacterales bacterium]|nr:DNA photolyase family protein [Chthoniobacterales bacterium]